MFLTHYVHMILSIRNIFLKAVSCHCKWEPLSLLWGWECIIFMYYLDTPTIQRFNTSVSPAFRAECDAALHEVWTRQMPPETPRLAANIRFALFNFVINHGASFRHQDYGHTINLQLTCQTPCTKTATPFTPSSLHAALNDYRGNGWLSHCWFTGLRPATLPR
jgi:hypothetical protein